MSEIRKSRFMHSMRHMTKRQTAPLIAFSRANRAHLEHFVNRHERDRNYITEFDPNAPSKVKKHNDAQLDFGHYPSYSKFKVPL